MIRSSLLLLLISVFCPSAVAVTHAAGADTPPRAAADSTGALRRPDCFDPEPCTDRHGRCASTRFGVPSVVIPASLMAIGVYGVYNDGFIAMDNSIKNGMDSLRRQRYLTFDDYVQYLPLASYLALDFMGVPAKHPLRERAAVGLTAYVAMAAIVQPVKHLIPSVRPDGRGDNSFPSGHTATAFLGAELVREEYGTAVGAAAYAVATGIGFMRMYNGRHWLKDVLAGAGVGIFAARVGYWMLPCYRKWFGWNRPGRAASPMVVAAPAYGYTPQTGHSLALGVSMRF